MSATFIESMRFDGCVSKGRASLILLFLSSMRGLETTKTIERRTSLAASRPSAAFGGSPPSTDTYWQY